MRRFNWPLVFVIGMVMLSSGIYMEKGLTTMLMLDGALLMFLSAFQWIRG